MNHDDDFHGDINYGNRFPDGWYFQEDKSSNYMKEEISNYGYTLSELNNYSKE